MGELVFLICSGYYTEDFVMWVENDYVVENWDGRRKGNVVK